MEEVSNTKRKKKIFSIAINQVVLDQLNNRVTQNSINKSALIEKLIIDWLEQQNNIL